MKENTKVTNKNYDLAGMRIGRLLHQYLRGKLIPLWSFSSELKLTHILGLLIRHRCGYAFAYLTTRYESQWIRLLTGWRTLSNKLQNQKENKHHPDN